MFREKKSFNSGNKDFSKNKGPIVTGKFQNTMRGKF